MYSKPALNTHFIKCKLNGNIFRSHDFGDEKKKFNIMDQMETV